LANAGLTADDWEAIVEVPELIKSASETTVTTLSHIVDDVKDRLDDVKDKLDTGLLHRHTPPPKKHVALKTLILLALLGMAAAVLAKKFAGQASSMGADNTSPDEARAAERWAEGVKDDRSGKQYDTSEAEPAHSNSGRKQ
jgi:hypothetical protein